MLDPEFQLGSKDKVTHTKITPKLQSFLKHCCHERHYFFDIKKCGEDSCSICKPSRLPEDLFTKLDHLPDPMPSEDGHYKQFAEVFQSNTVENYRPSLQNITKKRLPFYPSVQHVKNCSTMLQCDVCGMWRLVYATKKLNSKQVTELNQGLSFSCGADLQEADLPDELTGIVYAKKMFCHEPIEKLYYSANYTDICVHCAADIPPWSNSEEYYPQCEDCKDKIKIPNAKKK